MVHSELPDHVVVLDRLLDALQYEGDQWLWEPAWQLNADHPDVSLRDKIALARAVVTGLLASDVVELRLSPGWPDPAETELSASQLADILTDDAAWSDPENAAMLVQIHLRDKPRNPT